MLKYLPRASRAFLLSFPVVAGAFAAGYNPRPVAAQTGEPTCWAEWCEGNACVRIKIKCPTIIEPVVPT